MEQHTNGNGAPVKRERPTDPDDIAAALLAPFPPDVIGWRAGVMGKDKKSALAMCYIDARDVMKRLDQVLGVDGWQAEHYAIGSTQIACKLSIRVNGVWVGKTDGAWIGNLDATGKVDPKREQEIDMEAKGAFSAALKRAASMFGIGRYLYDLESPWADCEVNTEGRWKKWTENGLRKLNAVSAKPYEDFKKARTAKRAAEAKRVADEARAATPPAPPPSGPRAAAPAVPPGPAPANVEPPGSHQGHAGPPVGPPAAPPPEPSPRVPITAYPRPNGEPDVRQVLYTSSLERAETQAEVDLIITTVKEDPDFADGSDRKRAVGKAFITAMKRIVPGWTAKKVEAAAKKREEARAAGEPAAPADPATAPAGAAAA